MDPLKRLEAEIPDVTDPSKDARTMAVGATHDAAGVEAPPDIIVDNLNKPETSGDKI